MDDDSTNDGPIDEAVREAFRDWLEIQGRGELAGREWLAPGLSPAQRDDLDRLIRDWRVKQRLREALGRPIEAGDPGPKAIGVPGRYIDLRDPKAGGMGIVYRARDVELGRDVAYKVMNGAFGDADEFRRRFAREAEITARLQYPGIVPVFGMVTDGSGRPAYAMGYVEGTDFREIVRQPGVLRERLSSFLAACRIVEHAHKEKFVHGDLSLKNLMVADDGATHVVDWGLARCLDPDDPLYRPDGGPSPDSREPFTPDFAAPSVRDGGPRTYSTDVYSLGAILAALVLGVKPGGGPDLDGLDRRDVPRPLRAIIRAAMADGKDGPYPTTALADDLGRFLDGDRALVDIEPFREYAWRSIRRHPARATAILSSILILLIASTSAALVSAARERAARLGIEAARSREQAREFQAAQAMVRFQALWPTSEGSDPGHDADDEFLLLMLRAIKSLAPDPRPASDLIRSWEARLAEVKKSRPQREARRREQAEAEIRKAIESQEALAREFPDHEFHRGWLARFYVALGHMEMGKQGMPSLLWNIPFALAGRPRAQPRVEAALALVDKALEASPPAPNGAIAEELHKTRVNAWALRSTALMSLGRFTEALMSWDRAIEMDDSPGRPLAESTRLICRMGAEIEQTRLPWSRPPRVDHARAIRMADYLVDGQVIFPEAVFNAACAFALASLDEGAGPAERERRAGRAVALLARLEEQGAFRKPKPPGNLAGDKDLEPLRQRGDFQALAAKVAKGG